MTTTSLQRDEPTHETPIVLIAPAMAIGSRYYTPLIEEFTHRGWAAHALPHRGFDQPYPRACRRHDWSYRDQINDLAAAVAQARAQQPTRPVIVLGHSLGGQIAAGHELNHIPADGLVTVGASLPYHRHFPYFGLPVATMAALVVPTLTAIFGYLPQPAFGGPGARTLMREWARMALTGRTPYPCNTTITTPSLLISLDNDTLAPHRAVDAFADRLFDTEHLTRWHYCNSDVPPGATNDHITWVRNPAPVIDRITHWWQQQQTHSTHRDGPHPRKHTTAPASCLYCQHAQRPR